MVGSPSFCPFLSRYLTKVDGEVYNAMDMEETARYIRREVGRFVGCRMSVI